MSLFDRAGRAASADAHALDRYEKTLLGAADGDEESTLGEGGGIGGLDL